MGITDGTSNTILTGHATIPVIYYTTTVAIGNSSSFAGNIYLGGGGNAAANVIPYATPASIASPTNGTARGFNSGAAALILPLVAATGSSTSTLPAVGGAPAAGSCYFGRDPQGGQWTAQTAAGTTTNPEYYWGGPFAQGGLMGMMDATVRMFPYQTANLPWFLTPNGGEVVTLPDT